MTYFLGLDGGGTKTRCVIGDEHGSILGDQLAGPSNHQSRGGEYVSKVLKDLVIRTLDEARLTLKDLKGAFLCLSGADLPSDFELLHGICDSILQSVPYKVVNDAWAIMRSGLRTHWGAVCICGTGSNAAAADRQGNRAILRSLYYTLGNYGGGGEMAREALHHAFRHDEKTGPYTILFDRIPSFFGKNQMSEVVGCFYPESSPVVESAMKKIPPLVFELAGEGDEVCQKILIHMGAELGKLTTGVIKQVHMEKESFTVVLGGSVFLGENPLMVDAFTVSLHRVAPKAQVHLATMPPVVGAYYSALDCFGPIPSDKVYQIVEERYQ